MSNGEYKGCTDLYVQTFHGHLVKETVCSRRMIGLLGKYDRDFSLDRMINFFIQGELNLVRAKDKLGKGKLLTLTKIMSLDI